MKLDEFVEQSLSDILSGVNNARSKSPELSVGASSRAHFRQLLPGIMQDIQGALYTSVDFDVAVTVNNNGNGEASINVMGGQIWRRRWNRSSDRIARQILCSD